jgi:putative membrane protein
MLETATALIGALVPSANDHWDGPGAWILLFPLFWGLVILGIVWIVRGAAPWRRGWRPGSRPESGIEILERRFAQGEIDLDEYRKRRAILDE